MIDALFETGATFVAPVFCTNVILFVQTHEIFKETLEMHLSLAYGILRWASMLYPLRKKICSGTTNFWGLLCSKSCVKESSLIVLNLIV